MDLGELRFQSVVGIYILEIYLAYLSWETGMIKCDFPRFKRHIGTGRT